MAVKRNRLKNVLDDFVGELEDQLKNGKKVLTKEGGVERVSMDAATLNVIRQLLKDNGVEADPDHENSPLNRLLKTVDLPFADDALREHDTLN